ncbi:MAG: hydrogenase nickel incorporation protein HypB [Erysipelotrichaceae bacterium]|nr:hydrogenase nickel incorporation protein HypB [Erysipelotrichaceae bacterium]
MYEILETKERITADNDAEAAKLREKLKEKKVFFINLMGSPGAGKTSVLTHVINALKDRYRIGVMEADVDSSVDAETISKLGVKVIQLHSGGLCHMDADMTARGLDGLGIDGLDVVFLENIGNLVCPAEFDVGSAIRMMILSVPEGDDKPLKYPLMFTVSDVMLINKIDVAPIFDFDIERCKSYVRKLNPGMEFFPVSALKGDGLEEFENWLIDRIETWRNEA